MRLMANKLLELYGRTTPIYAFTGWNKEKVLGAGGWNWYLKSQTGVRGLDWITNRAYLLLDEAQSSYWDSEVWTDLFKGIETASGPHIVLFTSYGSPNRGFVGYDEKEYTKTPMTFGHAQQISLRQDEFLEDSGSVSNSLWKPVGLLLNEDEAVDVVTRYASSATLASHLLTQDLKMNFFACSNGHVGLLTSLVRVLHDEAVSMALYSRVQMSTSFD